MKNIILLHIVLISMSIQLLSQKLAVGPPLQPFEKIKFENFEPEWWHDIYDSTLVRNDTFNGYNSFRHIQLMTGEHSHDGRFYRCHSIREYDFMGFIVNCVDISSGELLWSKMIDTSLFQRQLNPIYQNFDAQGNLVIYGLRRKTPYNPREQAWGFSYPCNFFRIILDYKNGNLISYYSPDSKDDISFSAFSHNREMNITSFDTAGQIEFLLRKASSFPWSYKVFKGKVDSMSNMKFLDSLEYSPPNSEINRSRYAVKGDKYYCLEQNVNANVVHLLEIDTNLQVLNKFEVPFYNSNLRSGDVYRYTDNYIIYSIGFYVNDKLNTRFYIYDYEGNLHKLYEINSDFISNFSENRFEYDEKLDKLLILGLKIEQNFQSKNSTGLMHVIYYDGNTYDTRKIVEVSNKNRDYFPNSIYFDGDDHLIMDGRIGLVYYDDSGIVPRFRRSQFDWTHSILRVSRKEFGLETSTLNHITQENQFVVYPNPSTQYITIENIRSNDDVEVDIYDINGQKVVSTRAIDNTLDISHLTTGLYILDIKTQDRSERHKIIKID